MFSDQIQLTLWLCDNVYCLAQFVIVIYEVLKEKFLRILPCYQVWAQQFYCLRWVYSSQRCGGDTSLNHIIILRIRDQMPVRFFPENFNTNKNSLSLKVKSPFPTGTWRVGSRKSRSLLTYSSTMWPTFTAAGERVRSSRVGTRVDNLLKKEIEF